MQRDLARTHVNQERLVGGQFQQLFEEKIGPAFGWRRLQAERRQRRRQSTGVAGCAETGLGKQMQHRRASGWSALTRKIPATIFISPGRWHQPHAPGRNPRLHLAHRGRAFAFRPRAARSPLSAYCNAWPHRMCVRRRHQHSAARRHRAPGAAGVSHTRACMARNLETAVLWARWGAHSTSSVWTEQVARTAAGVCVSAATPPTAAVAAALSAHCRTQARSHACGAYEPHAASHPEPAKREKERLTPAPRRAGGRERRGERKREEEGGGGGGPCAPAHAQPPRTPASTRAGRLCHLAQLPGSAHGLGRAHSLWPAALLRGGVWTRAVRGGAASAAAAAQLARYRAGSQAHTHAPATPARGSAGTWVCDIHAGGGGTTCGRTLCRLRRHGVRCARVCAATGSLERKSGESWPSHTAGLHEP